MTGDELVSAFTVALAEMHAQLDDLDDGPVKARAVRLANVAHGAMEALQDHLAQNGVVQPLDGTGKPNP